MNDNQDEGELCLCCKTGHLAYEREPCTCGIHPPPCSACEYAELVCDHCDHAPNDKKTYNGGYALYNASSGCYTNRCGVKHERLMLGSALRTSQREAFQLAQEDCIHAIPWDFAPQSASNIQKFLNLNPTTNRKDTTMSNDHKTILALQAQKGIRTIKVRYKERTDKTVPELLTYKCAIPVKIGDAVLVQLRGWYQVMTVDSIDAVADLTCEAQVRWVVANLQSAVELSQAYDQSDKESLHAIQNARAIKTALEVAKMSGIEDVESLISIPSAPVAPESDWLTKVVTVDPK